MSKLLARIGSLLSPDYNRRGRSARRDKRLAVGNRCEVNGIKGRLVDLTIRGCGFIPDEPDFQIGNDVVVDLIGKYEERIRVEGRIVSSDKQVFVFGVRFTAVSASAMSKIKEILANAERRQPED